jgi:hypothetical protein
MHADRRRIRRLLRFPAVALVAASAEATTVPGVLIDETSGAQTTPRTSVSPSELR